MKTLFILCLISFASFSQTTYIWDGDSDGDGDGQKWSDPFNWNLDEEPKPGSIVEIGSDSVLLSSPVQIQQLILESGGILYYEGSDESQITGSTGDGIVINGGAKLYINGLMRVSQTGGNGIDLQANSDMTIMEDEGFLIIEDVAADGILGGIAATFLNKGALQMNNIGGEGLDLRYFMNFGEIQISDCGVLAAKIAGSVAYNNGTFDLDDNVLLQLSTSFLNDSNAVFRARKQLTVLCDFQNKGRVDLRNTSNVSLDLQNGVTFTNEDLVTARTTTSSTFSFFNGAVFENLPAARLVVTPSTNNGFSEYLFVLDGVGTKLLNRGIIDLDLGSRLEGFHIGNRAVIENYGDISLKNYYSEGVYFNSLGVNTEVIQNLDTAYFYIDKSPVFQAVALELNTRTRVKNDSCAQFVIKDSLAIQGSLGMKIENYGFMEIEKFSKKSNATFENEGAVFINDTSLAHNPNPTLVAQITNNGLITTPIPGPAVENQSLSPFFADIVPANVKLFFNQTWLYDPNTGIVTFEGGPINLSTNTWTPNFRAPDADTLVIFYQHIDNPCNDFFFTIELPIISQGCNPVTYIFNQSVDNKWNNPLNWTPQGVPSPCDHAIIPSGTSCMLVPNYPGFGVAKTLLVEQGGVFETFSPILLTIDPSE